MAERGRAYVSGWRPCGVVGRLVQGTSGKANKMVVNAGTPEVTKRGNEAYN